MVTYLRRGLRSVSLVLAVILTACGSNVPQVDPEPSPTTVAASPTAEATATTAATATPAPTATSEPTATPEPDPTLGELELGETVRGSIDEEGGENIWALFAEEGSTLYIKAETVRGGLEPFITIRDSDGGLVASSERSGPEASLVETVGSDDAYQVIIGAFGDETGTYEVTAYITGGGETEYGQTVTGLVIGGLEEVWTFEAEPGDFVSIGITAEDDEFDTYFELYDENENLVTRDDDSGTDRNPLIQNFPLILGGDYRIVVSAFGEEAGSYELSLEQGEASGGGTIAYSETIEDELDEGESHLWSFEAQAGDVVFVTADAVSDGSGLDTRLALHDPEGALLATDDDGGGNRNARLAAVSLTESGTYYVIVSTYGGSTGAYALTVRPSTGEEAVGGVLVFDQHGQGTIEEGSVAAWSFEGQQGDVVTIALTAAEDNLDGYLTLTGPSGQELATDDDSGGDFNPLIQNFPLLATGTYTVQASVLSGFGSYEILLTRGEAQGGGAVAYGQTVQGEMPERGAHLWIFDGQEGDSIEVAVNAAEGVENLDLNVTLYNASGEELAFDDDSGDDLNSLLTDVTLPASGSYSLLVRTFGSGSGAYTLSLSQP